MYSSLPSFVLGFHGCDKKVAEAVFSGKDRLMPSENSHDWLGHGIYFWENNHVRALEYAKVLKKYPGRGKQPINTPAVIGAIIDCGNCLNLLEAESIEIVKQAHKSFIEMQKSTAFGPMPKNELIEDGFPMRRNLDCAVMETLHIIRKEQKKLKFDSVKAMFPEGKKLYPDSGFLDKNHIQICIRNPNCIKGYFRILEQVDGYSLP